MKQLFISTCLLSGALSLHSCIDKDYDFNNTNGDNLQMFDNISLPLGNTEQLSPSGYLYDIKEFKQNENGEYFAIYSDTLQVKIPEAENLSVNPVHIKNNQIIPFPDQTDFQLPTPLRFADNFTESFLPTPVNNSFIKQINSLDFDTNKNQSQLSFTLAISGIQIKDQSQSKATVQLTALLPSGSLVETIDGSKITNNYSLSAGNNFSSTYKLKTLNFNQDNTIQFSVSLVIPEGEVVSINNPQLEIRANFDNPVVTALTGQINFESSVTHQIYLTSFYDFISDEPDNNLALAHPQLFIRSQATHGIPLMATGSISSTKKNEPVATLPLSLMLDKVNNEQLLQPHNFLFADEKPVSQEAAQWVPLKLKSLVNPIPDTITLDLKAAPVADATHRILSNSTMQLIYDLNMPLAFTDSLHLTIRDTIFSVLDTDIRQKLFSSGEAEIYGTIATTLPIDVTLQLIPVNSDYQEIGITFEPQRIAASIDGKEHQRKISLFVGEENIQKMQEAEHFLAFIRISSDQINDRILKGSDYIQASLRVRKKGGIAL